MRRSSFLTILLLVSTFFVYGQSNDEQAIRQVLNEITAANKTGDFKAFDHIYASDFIFINSAGKKYNKTERLAYLKATPLPTSFAFKNEQIRMYGTTAVVNTVVNITPKGQDAQSHEVTIIMVKKGGLWQEVNVQVTTKATNQ